MERNVPKLRFKGFNDEWKEKKLSEIANIVGGGTPSTTEKSYWDGNIQWFTPTEIKDAKYVASSMRTITEQGVKNSSAKILPKGSILLTTRATLGEMAILENDATTNQGFQSLIVNKNNNNEFVYYLQEKIKKYCYKNASGSTFLEISKSNLEKFKVNMPSLQEQERIANFLTKVDKIIEKQEEKVKNLENYKKGMMQKIFSQEIRFKDENGNEYPEWKEKSIKEIATIIGGGTPSTTESKYWDGNIQRFTPTEIKVGKYISKSVRTITELGVKKSSAKILPKGAILLTTRATLGDMAILENEATTNQGFQSLIVNEKNSNEFVYYLQDKIKEYCIKHSSGSTFLEVSKSNLEKFKFRYPCLEEQLKIANLLSNIDEIINNEKNKLEELKRWKKGLLQQMFV